MNRHRSPVVVAAALVAVLSAPPQLAAQEMAPAGEGLAPVGTAFTYQGFLTQSGVPATGAWDFQFLLFDAAVAGAQIGVTSVANDLPTSAGVFTATVDVGVAAFGGGARWLEIRVRPGASGGAYTPLTPRQPVTPAPMALSLPNVYTDEASNFVGVGRDFRISGNEVFGIRHNGVANDYGGMYVETSNAGGWPFYGYATNGSFRAWHYYNGTDGDWRLYNAGIRLTVPNEGGLRIGPSADYSLVIENSTGTDGIRIYDTGDDAIQIGSDPDVSNYGVYIPSPGVSAYGLWPNTAEAAGQWALFTVDSIEAANVFTAGVTQIARVGADAELVPGDVVAAVGFGAGMPGSIELVPAVIAADGATREAVIGVVHSRMALVPVPGDKKGLDSVGLHSVPGVAVEGDFVAITVQGVALARVAPDAGIEAGQRLTASDTAGLARALRTVVVDGVTLAESASTIGVALALPTEEGLVPVYVRAR
ncbi:MAG: hypothetical protein AMXMBFR36_26870 [Acidobacteriota bacterium]